MNARNQLICAHSFIPFMLVLLICVFIVPAWLPPMSPSLDAETLASYFRDNNSFRLCIVVAAFIAPFFLGNL